MSSLRCDVCGDVIGVYEPVIVLRDEEARETSVARQPELSTQDGLLHHRACFLAAGPPHVDE